MKHSCVGDKVTRFSILKQKFFFQLFRTVRSNHFLTPCIRLRSGYKLFFLPSVSRVHNYCTTTSRSRSILREFKLSRLEFKKFVGLKLITGVKRSSY
jgi:ribosomal protein S14